MQLNFPLHLWGEVAAWWQLLSWSPLAATRGSKDKVTWLELVIDFELSTGVNCAHPDKVTGWGEKAVMLRQVVKLILSARGGGPKELHNLYGEDKNVYTLAPFGKKEAAGLRRRPKFVDESTPKAVARNAWTWACDPQETPIQKHTVNYSGFTRGCFKDSSARQALAAACSSSFEAAGHSVPS